MAKLHYLYEQQEKGREMFVYYCASCRCVLNAGRDLRPASETVSSHDGRCSGCGRGLEGSVECTLAPVPDEWSDVYSGHRPEAGRKYEIFKASSLLHFSLGFSPLDSMLRPLTPGHLAVLSGGPSSAVVELAAFRAQLPIERGGLDSAVLFVDAGNRSDPYLFSSLAKRYGVKPAKAMRRVTTCRVFTLYQLADLFSRYLVKAADDYAARLVVVSDALATFNEPELDEREARWALSTVEQGVTRLKRDALVLVTLVSPSKYDDIPTSWADTVVSMSSAGRRVKAELIKHRSRPPTTAGFRRELLSKRAS